MSGFYVNAPSSVNVLSSALPTGASTEATLALVKAKTDNLDVAISTLQTLLSAIKTGGTDRLDANISTLATQATAALIKAKTDNLDVALSTLASQATLAAIKAKTDNLDVLLSTIATQATALLIKAKTDNLDVAISTLAKESGGNLAAIAGKDFATQTTLATLLTTINALNAKVPALGQATMANSEPSVIASDQTPIPFDLQNFCRSLAQQFVSAFTRSNFIKRGGGSSQSGGTFDTFPVYVDAFASGLTLSSVTTVGGITNLGGIPIRDISFTPQERQIWAGNVRSRIS